MQILKLGSIVSISHFTDEDALICSDGFIKKSVYLKGMSPFQYMDDNDRNQMNILNCLFMICPRMSSSKSLEAKRFIKKQKIKLEDVTDRRSEIVSIKSQNQSIVQQNNDNISLKDKDALFYEYKFYVETFEKEYGKYVKYDEQIQLLHLASSKWLCSSQQEAKFEKQNLQFKLTSVSSQDTLFKIIPQYKYQKEGNEFVYSSECIRIIKAYSIGGKIAYLHCSGEIPQKSILRSNHQNIAEKNIRKREINASLEESTQWKINIFSEEQPVYGNLVWIHHSETCSQLAVEYHKELLKTKFIAYQSDPSELSFDTYTGNPYSLWIIENAEDGYKNGGQYQYKKKYRLKHFHTGQYLACVKNLPVEKVIKQDPYGKKLISVPQRKVAATFSLKIIPNQDCEFQFEPLKQLEKQEIGSDFIQIYNIGQKKYIDIKQNQSQQLKPIILNQRNEHAVFKIFRASNKDIQEILFLDSCTKQLQKYLQYQNLKYQEDQYEQKMFFKLINKKINTTIKCIQKLDDFIKQRIYNFNPQQKFGFICPNRQKLLRQQHFFETLLEILQITVNKNDLDIFCKNNNKDDQQSINSNQEKEQQLTNEDQQKSLILKKVNIINNIFNLLTTSVMQNYENQLYLYEKLPDYQFYCKYLPSSVNFLIALVQNNQQILLNLCSNLKIEFDYANNEEIIEDINKQVKVLINFYQKETNIDDAIQIKPHDRIITKPINILQYFFNLLLDTQAINKEYYLKFLRNICRFKNNSISNNQENLYKLYKRYYRLQQQMNVQNIFEIDIYDKDISKELRFELLQFYSEVTYGRNYLWKNELEGINNQNNSQIINQEKQKQKFTVDFLVNQVWNNKNQSENQLRPYLCKLGRSLYIDQQPYKQLILPNYCRLFQSHKVQFINNNIFQLDGLFQFLKEKSDIIINTLEYDVQSLDLLNDELIYNLAESILIMMKLNIIPQEYFGLIIDKFSKMIFYDQKNIPYLRLAHNNYKKVIENRIKAKNDVGGVNAFKNLMGDFTKNENTTKKQREEEDQNLLDQPNLFLNPIMRGFMTINSKIEIINTIPKSNIEIEFKLKICSILDHFLDRRQDFLISNIQVWFEQYKYQDNDLSDEDDDQTEKAAPKMLENNYQTLIPNIARTGIDEIDQPPPQEFDLLQQIQMQFKKETDQFINYIDKYAQTHIEEFQELDYYLSSTQKDIKQDGLKNQQVASLFPYLISTYFLVKDQVLEERCLNIIMRLFNQREELVQNIKKVQIIFDDNKTKEFDSAEQTLQNINDAAERTEIWLTKFKIGQDIQQEIQKITNNIQVLGKFMKIPINSNKDRYILDIEKQSIMKFLKAHEIIIILIQNGMPHFIEVLQDSKMNKNKKEDLMNLFKEAHQFLIYFCSNNRANQLLLYNNIQIFLQYLQYDVGQSRLIYEIYKNNAKLLNTGSHLLLNKIIQLIELEGRQVRFIDQLINLITLRDNNNNDTNKKNIGYVFENQWLIMNTFIPMRELTDIELRRLYSEGRQIKDIQFYLEDPYIELEDNLLIKLESIDWQDSYRDEPFLYHSKLLDLLLQCSLTNPLIRHYNPYQVENQIHSFNICVFKIKKIIQPQYLIDLLLQHDSMVDAKTENLDIGNILNQQFIQLEGYTQLKPIVCEFLRLVYITSQKNKDAKLGQYQKQFVSLIEYEFDRLSRILKAPTYKQNYIIYTLDYFIPLLIEYCENILIDSQIEFKQAMIKYSSIFAQWTQTLQENLTNLTKTQIQIICKLKELFDNSYYPQHMQFNDQEQIEDNIEYDLIQHQNIPVSYNNSQLKKESQQDKQKPTIFHSLSNFKSVIQNKKSQHIRKNMDFRQQESQWKIFVETMSTSNSIEQSIELERQALADAIINIDKLSQDNVENQNNEIKPSFQSIIKKLINFLQTAVLQQDNKPTILILLKIMSKIIEKDEKQSATYQKLFDNLGATRMVLNVITDYQQLLSNDILLNLINFLNVLLQGGNIQVQKTVYTFCITQQKSEIIFSIFSKYIEKATAQIIDDDSEEAELNKQIVNSILKFFQNCTEGHYNEMQNYIRYQSNSRASKDIINLVADLFKNYERTSSNFDNLVRCLDTLNELVQGPCPENQIAVADSKFFDVVQEMFPLRETNEFNDENVIDDTLNSQMKAQLQNKILVLMLSLLEKREIKGKESIIKQIMRVLPINVLEENLSKVYDKWFKLYQGDYNFEAFKHNNGESDMIIENGFYIMFLICYYLESDQEFDSQVKNYNKQYIRQQNKDNALFDPNSTLGQLYNFLMELYELSVQKTLQQVQNLGNNQQENKDVKYERKLLLKKPFMFFREHTAHIEVIRDDNIELVFFPILPSSKLNKEEKLKFQQLVDRASAKSKVQYLLEQVPEFIEIMDHEEKIRRFYKQYKTIGFFANYIKLWKDIAFYLTLVINIIILGSFSHQTNYTEMTEDEANNEALQQYSFFREDDWSQQRTKNVIQTIGIVMTVSALLVVAFVLAKIAPLVIIKGLRRKPIFTGQIGLIQSLINWLSKFFFVLFYCLRNVELVYYMAYGALSVAGTIIHPFFFCFHLTIILTRFQTIGNVVRSVTEPWQQLVLTLLLIIIITYVFTLIAFYALQDFFGNDCKIVYLCFLQIFDKNFKVPGGIGGDITNNDPSPDYKVFRYIFDQFNNIILVIILIAIASGIIIDTFGQLREEENIMISDTRDKCFMCGQENTIFERKSDGSSGGFKTHIRQNHYMWNYLYYIAYLNWKNKDDYSGIESYVDKKLKDKDLSWIPFGKARELQLEEDQSIKQANQMEQSSLNLTDLADHSKKILEALRKKKNSDQQLHTSPTKENLKTQQSVK